MEDGCGSSRLPFFHLHSNICGYLAQHQFWSSVLGLNADNVFLRNGSSDLWPTKSKQFGARKTGKPDAGAFISAELVVWCTFLKAFMSHVNIKGNGNMRNTTTDAKQQKRRQDVAFGGAPHSKRAAPFRFHSEHTRWRLSPWLPKNTDKLHVSTARALFSLYSCATADNERTIIIIRLTVLTFFHSSWHFSLTRYEGQNMAAASLTRHNVCFLPAFSGERI